MALAIQNQLESRYLRQFPVSLKPLLSFECNHKKGMQCGILFSLRDYLELVDYTGRSRASDGELPDYLTTDKRTPVWWIASGSAWPEFG